MVPFEEIQSHEAAYFLGLLKVNGSIYFGTNRIVLSWKPEYKDMVERFKNWISSYGISASLNFYDGVVRCSIINKEVMFHVVRYGMLGKKPERKFAALPEELVIPYIRGLLDGGGTIINRGLNKEFLRLSASMDILITTQQWLNHFLAIPPKKIEVLKNNQCPRIKYGSYSDIQHILELLKPEDDLYTKGRLWP